MALYYLERIPEILQNNRYLYLTLLSKYRNNFASHNICNLIKLFLIIKQHIIKHNK